MKIKIINKNNGLKERKKGEDGRVKILNLPQVLNLRDRLALPSPPSLKAE
jgi:hypothetical protein